MTEYITKTKTNIEAKFTCRCCGAHFWRIPSLAKRYARGGQYCSPTCSQKAQRRNCGSLLQGAKVVHDVNALEVREVTTTYKVRKPGPGKRKFER